MRASFGKLFWWYNALMSAKKRKRRKIRPSILISLEVLAALILVAAGLMIFRKKQPEQQADVQKETAAETKKQESLPLKTPEPEPEEYSASLFMLGDALVQINNSEYARQADGSYDWHPMMDGITGLAADYDLSFYNQECILGGDELGITPFPHFNCPQSFGDYMISKGFNLVSTANNHSLDKGAAGVEGSDAYWKAHPEIVTNGIFTSQEDHDASIIHEINGIRYAFTAWTYDMNGNLCPEGRGYMVNQYRGYENELLDTVRRADQEVDFVIVSMHWGTEYTHNPDEEQLRLAQQLADAGADLIIGNHAHNIQPVEWLNDGKTLCFYALGNLINGQDFPDYTTYDDVNTGMGASLVLNKTVMPDGTVTTSISDVRIDLLYTWTNNYETFGSVWYSDLNDSIFPGYQGFYQSLIDNVVHAYDDSFTIGFN